MPLIFQKNFFPKQNSEAKRVGDNINGSWAITLEDGTKLFGALSKEDIEQALVKKNTIYDY